MSTDTVQVRDSAAMLVELYDPIADDLQAVERIIATEMTGTHRYVNEMLAGTAGYRGKRLRPALVLLSGLACGEINPHHHTLGAVVEMIHTATLIHDDVLDNASIRRHLATVNVSHGNRNSILLGDFLFSQAFRLASTTGSTLACNLIGQATTRTCEGEMLQNHHTGNLDLTEREYFDIIQRKTAELCACSCHLGATFTPGAPEQIDALTSYGSHLGIAFQIIDDLLDVTGREDTTGKSLGTDAAQRKMTLPLIRFREQADRRALAELDEVLSANIPNQSAVLQSLLAESDALESALASARDHVERAVDDLQVLPATAAREVLTHAAQFVVERDL